MKVHLGLLDGRVKVEPAEYMPEVWFDSMTRAVRAAGAQYHRIAKMNLVEVAALPRLIEVLAGSGFQSEISAELKAAAAADAISYRERVREVSGRFKPAVDGSRLFPFQEQGAAWLGGLDRALLGDDMGVGKTMQLLVAAPRGPVIVITKAKARGPWVRHAQNWRPDLQARMLSGRGSFTAPTENHLFVTSYEILPMTPKEGGFPLEIAPGTTIIWDEAHKLGRLSQMTKRARELNKAVWKAGGRVWGATGTPLDNKPDKLACIMTTLGLFQRAFGDFPSFLRVFRGKKGFFGGFEYDLKAGARPEAADCLRRVMLRRLYRDVFPDLPAKIYDPPIEVDIPKAAIKAVRDAQLLMELEGLDLEQVVMQGSGSLEVKESMFRMRKLLAEAKIPHMLEIVEEYEEAETPLIVFSAHRGPVEALRARPGWRVITGDDDSKASDEIQQAFQAGELRGLGISIRAGGDALTLTYAHHALFVDLEWGPTVNHQAESRLDRYGQTRGVVIKRLVAKGTLDENVEILLRDKKKLIKQTVDAAAVKDGEVNPIALAEALEKAIRS